MSLYLSESILSKRKNSRHLTGTPIPPWKLSSGTLSLSYSFYIQRTLLKGSSLNAKGAWKSECVQTHRNPTGKNLLPFRIKCQDVYIKTDWNVLIMTIKHWILCFCIHASRTKHWIYHLYLIFVYQTLISYLNYVPSTYVYYLSITTILQDSKKSVQNLLL